MPARALLLAIACLAVTSLGLAQTARSLQVYWIDVEGGAATLIVTPAGESVLVDAGNPGGRDAGRIVKTAKETAHLQRIDFLVVTHLHVDHFGGVAELASMMPIGTLYENGIESAPAAERGQAAVDAYRAARVAGRVAIRPGVSLPLKAAPGAAAVSLRVLGARQMFAPSAATRPNEANCQNLGTKPIDTSDNANSVVMVLEQGPFRMFLGGDLTWNVEANLVCPIDRVGTVDVYQSVHHGLDLSNNPALVHTLQPRVVVFNDGPRKGLEINAVTTVMETPSVQAIFQLHRGVREGARNTAAERIANAEETCAGEGINMTVAPDGSNYDIAVPSTRFQRSFVTLSPKR